MIIIGSIRKYLLKISIILFINRYVVQHYNNINIDEMIPNHAIYTSFKVIGFILADSYECAIVRILLGVHIYPKQIPCQLYH